MARPRNVRISIEEEDGSVVHCLPWAVPEPEEGWAKYCSFKPEPTFINGRKCIEVDAVKVFEMASLHERMNPPKVKK